MAERTAPPRHEPGRAAVPVVLVPRVLLVDHRLSIGARGLASVTVARGGSINLRPDYLDELSELLDTGYVVLDGPAAVLTPVAGWGA